MHVLFSDWTTDRTSPTATSAASAHGSCSRRRRASRTSTRASAPSRSAPLTAQALGMRLAGRRAPLKSALLDQRTVAGLGNIYADEALWYGRLHPLRPAGSLDGDELRPAPPFGQTCSPHGDRAPGVDAARLHASRRRRTGRCRRSSAPTGVAVSRATAAGRRSSGSSSAAVRRRSARAASCSDPGARRYAASRSASVSRTPTRSSATSSR